MELLREQNIEFDEPSLANVRSIANDGFIDSKTLDINNILYVQGLLELLLY